MQHVRDVPPEAAMLRAALARGGRARLRTRGASMLPAIAPGTLLTVTARPFAQVVPGDVVAAVIDARIIVHRVVAASPAGLLTLGDNLPLLDPPVAPHAYLGVVPEHHARPPRRRPDPAALGPHPGGNGPGRVRILVPGPAAAHRAHGVDVRRCADPGRLPGPVIGISPYGALPPGALDTVLRAAGSRDVTVLVGYSFGYGSGPGADGAGELLPPDLADLHIRFGTPLAPPGSAAALGFVADRVRRLRPAPPPAPPMTAPPAASVRAAPTPARPAATAPAASEAGSRR
ncbi:S24/S26 family peptidase [Streptomyces sp. NPDC002073]